MGTDEVLACSRGLFTEGDFERIISYHALASSEEPPQVTVAWVGAGDKAHVVLAVEEWSGERDGMGRAIAMTRCFCVPYAQAASGPLSYEGLYTALPDLAESPSDDPLVVEGTALDPAALAGRADRTAIGAAALLVTGQPVCILRAEHIPLIERLRFLDVVVALLPYGFRTRFTASTWTNSAARHRIRLSFARHPQPGALAIGWGGEVVVPEGYDAARAYHGVLLRDDLADLIARFSRDTEPRSFTAEHLGKLASSVAPPMAPPPASPRRRPSDKELREFSLLSPRALLARACAESADARTVELVLAEVVSRWGDRSRRDAICAALRGNGAFTAVVERFASADPDGEFDRRLVLFAAKYGPRLSPEALREAFATCADSPPALAALSLLCEGETRGLLLELVFHDLLCGGGLSTETLAKLRDSRNQ